MNSMFNINKKDEKEFRGDKESWREASLAAKECIYFKLDDEDEQIADDLRSCYNCRFRRWTEKSFTCSK